MKKGTRQYISDSIGYRISQFNDTPALAVPAYLAVGATFVFNAVSLTTGAIKAPTYEIDETSTEYSQVAYERFDDRMGELATLNDTVKKMEFSLTEQSLYVDEEDLDAKLLQDIEDKKTELNDDLKRLYGAMLTSEDLTETDFSSLQDRAVEEDFPESSFTAGGYYRTLDIKDLPPESFKEIQEKINFDDDDSIFVDADLVENAMRDVYDVSASKVVVGMFTFLGSALGSAMLLTLLACAIHDANLGRYNNRPEAPKLKDYKTPGN